jgi:hypothetical protein
VARAVVAGLALSLVLSGCRDITTGGTRAEITTGIPAASITSANWVSCAEAGCRFRAEGRNEGPACARNIAGLVQFTGEDGARILLLDPAGQPAPTAYAWRTDPNPAEAVRAGTSFAYVTARVPAQLIAAAVEFTSTPQQADIGC